MPPKILTIRQVAATGVLSEHALRLLQKQGRLPCLYVGNRCLVNYDKLLAQLDNLGCVNTPLSFLFNGVLTQPKLSSCANNLS